VNESTEEKIVSLCGNPIYHHTESTPWSAPQGEVCIEQISTHIERHLGTIETVFHELVSDTVHIDVHFVKPSEKFPFVRLVTSGMSDLPMTTPPEIDVPKFVELVVTLPPDWKLDQKSLEDENWYWPVRQIKYLARLPHKYQTWLGWGHTVPNGDPAEPYAANTELNGSIVLPSITVPDAFHTLKIDEEKEITFYAVVPLYKEEMDLKLRSGTDKLLERLGKKGITDVIDPKRTNVARKLFGLL
jgi:hypothetical protein